MSDCQHLRFLVCNPPETGAYIEVLRCLDCGTFFQGESFAEKSCEVIDE